MSKDKELEIQMQFLEEARDYLNILEAVLLEIDTSRRINLQRINAALRAAHSIKGGAGMMGYRTLSDLAHRLEDSFKVLKTRKNSREIDPHTQNLLLSTVDWLRQIIESLSQGNEIEQQWLDSFCYPVFEELRDHLGEPSPEDAATILSPEDGQDIIPMLFQTEVEGCLQRLESVLADTSQPCLQEEVAIMAAELGGLGEILQLPAFTSLCGSIGHHISTVTSDRIPEVAQLALQAWRRSQALVLKNQAENIPTEIHLSEANIDTVIQTQTTAEVIRTEHKIFYAENTSLADTSVTHTEEKNSVAKDWETRENTVRVPIQQLDKINDLFAELTVQRNGLNFQLQKLRKLLGGLHQGLQTLERENYQLQTTYEKIAYQSVNTNLVETVGEYKRRYIQKFPTLEIARHEEINLRSREIMESIVDLQELTTDIQLSVDDTDQIYRKLNQTSKQLGRKINHIRMRPFSDLVDRFPRALHDLNSEYGKNVQLKVEGKNTLIARSILEALNEPIMHLLRNAFDHGIEDPATRRALGKPEQGLIEITASHRSNRIIITMRDDGRGISLENLRSRAVEMGLDATLLANASDEELLSLIFEPGFSTSLQVTALSGRGVGMDIVRNNLKSVHGEIRVDTELGVGTTFTLTIPLALSVGRVLVVESNKMLLAFPTEVVAEIFLLQNEQVSSIGGSDVLNWQGNTLPLINLSRYFQFNSLQYNHPELETPPVIKSNSALILKGNHQPVAIQVDRCWGEQEVAIREVEGNISLPTGLSNCAILGDGRVLLLVNANELLHLVATHQVTPQKNQLSSVGLRTALPLFNGHQPPGKIDDHKSTILIVDDSINVCRFLTMTLQKGGYRVEQAQDGQDALEKLQRGLKVAAVICDIEMPRLDGYAFLGYIKTDIEIKNIPVVMISSHGTSQYRELAMQLGAEAYFRKPYQEEELLNTLAEIIGNVRETVISQ